MTILEMVKKAIRKSGAKVDVPTTLAGATGLTELFVEWVQDAWKSIQLERLGWYWRVIRDQVMAINNTEDEYPIPASLESINTRTVTLYSTVADEALLTYIPYDEWRRRKDIASPSPSRPTCYCITPGNKIALWPFPDAAYTLRYDGVLAVEILNSADDNDTPTNLNSAYHDAIVWLAVSYYARHFEDGSKFAEAMDMFRPYKKYFEDRALPDISIDVSSMYRQ